MSENETIATEARNATKTATDRRSRGRARGNVQSVAPRHIDVSKLDAFGFRLGTKKAMAAAMYAKKPGATLSEVKKAVGTPQFNVLTEMDKRGFVIERTPVSGPTGKKVLRFHVVGVRR